MVRRRYEITDEAWEKLPTTCDGKSRRLSINITSVNGMIVLSCKPYWMIFVSLISEKADLVSVPII
jgi:hypothetical protein